MLACGAVANARQLLLSNAGNEHDLVGRNFMGHPLMNGVITMNRDYLTPDQARFMTGTSPSGHWHDQTTHVPVSARFIPNAQTVRAHGIGRCWFAYNYGLLYFSQAPNPDSRITLSDSVDPVFGQRQTRCDWQLSALDETTFQTATQLFTNAVSALGGQVSVNLPWELVRSNLVIRPSHGNDAHGQGRGPRRGRPEPPRAFAGQSLCRGIFGVPVRGSLQSDVHHHCAVDPAGGSLEGGAGGRVMSLVGFHRQACFKRWIF